MYAIVKNKTKEGIIVKMPGNIQTTLGWDVFDARFVTDKDDKYKAHMVPEMEGRWNRFIKTIREIKKNLSDAEKETNQEKKKELELVSGSMLETVRMEYADFGMKTTDDVMNVINNIAERNENRKKDRGFRKDRKPKTEHRNNERKPGMGQDKPVHQPHMSCTSSIGDFLDDETKKALNIKQ